MWGLPAALLCLLALPFHPFWPDYETARRGLLLICAGAVAIAGRRWFSGRPDAGTLLLLALAAWHLVRSIGVANPALGVNKGMVWAALAIVYSWGRGRRSEEWLGAGLFTGLVVSAYGLVQALGLPLALHRALWEQSPDPTTWSPAWLWLQSFLGFDEAAPVSTLGNLNFASELAALGSSAAAVVLVRNDRWRLAWAALAVGAAYLVVNGSRSGLVALPLACLFALAQPGERTRRRLLMLTAVLAGVGTGTLGHLVRTGGADEPTGSSSAATAPAARPSTVEVRLRIWESCAAMAAERPVLGQGSGQFPVDYPRFRSQREIELSTVGLEGPRSFAAAPRTAHNDHLEILVETGVPGLLLWWAFLAVALRTALRSGTAAAAPLVALLVLTLVRSPMGNAPVAALAIGYAGSLRPRAAGAPAAWPVAAAGVVFGALAIWLGLGAVISQTIWAADPRAARFELGSETRREAVDGALRWSGSDPDLLSLRLRRRVEASRTSGLRAADVDADLDALATLDPYDTATLLLRADAANLLGQPGRALSLLEQLHALDPGDPLAALLEAVIHTEQGRPAAAIVALYRAPYPRLRPGLSTTFADLAAVAQAHGRPAAEVLTLQAESAFVAAVDALAADAQSEAAMSKTLAFGKLLVDAGVTDDVRPLLLGALTFEATNPERAARLGEGALQRGLELTGPHRRLLGSLPDRLRAIPAWQKVLER